MSILKKRPNNLVVYIDGFNLYHAIHDLRKPHLKWLNLMRLSQQLLREGEIVKKVRFFTTVVDWNAEKKARHETYIAALEAKGVVVTRGTFKKSDRHCATHNNICPFREEKQTDVAIGIGMVADAFNGDFERMVLITADTDQIPAIECIQREFPGKGITWLAPPGRMKQAREIGDLIKDRSEISEGLLASSRLPAIVMNEKQEIVCRMPDEYKPPA